MMIRLELCTGAWWGYGYRTEAVVFLLCESISSKQSSLGVGFAVLLVHPIANRMLIGPFWFRPSAAELATTAALCGTEDAISLPCSLFSCSHMLPAPSSTKFPEFQKG